MNTLLAEQLRSHGLSARAERRSREGTPDVRIELRSGYLLLLECKWEGSAGLLNEQIRQRLGQFPEALGILGVVYPDRLQSAEDIHADLSGAGDLGWRLHGSRGGVAVNQPDRSGSVEDFAAQLRYLPLELEGGDRVDAAAAIVGYAVEKAVEPVGQHQKLARRVSDIIAEADKESDRLAALHPDVPTVQEARREGLGGLRRAWQSICDDIDYVSVFDIAGQISDVLIDGPADVQGAVMNSLTRPWRTPASWRGMTCRAGCSTPC